MVGKIGLKKYIYFFCIFSCLSLFGQPKNERAKVYLCSRLTEKAKAFNDLISTELEEDFILFRPQDIDLSKVRVNAIDAIAYQKDLEGMKNADLLLSPSSLW